MCSHTDMSTHTGTHGHTHRQVHLRTHTHILSHTRILSHTQICKRKRQDYTEQPAPYAMSCRMKSALRSIGLVVSGERMQRREFSVSRREEPGRREADHRSNTGFIPVYISAPGQPCIHPRCLKTRGRLVWREPEVRVCFLHIMLCVLYVCYAYIVCHECYVYCVALCLCACCVCCVCCVCGGGGRWSSGWLGCTATLRGDTHGRA